MSVYPTLAINLLRRLHGQVSQLHNFISALKIKFIVIKNLWMLWVLFTTTEKHATLLHPLHK